MGRSLVHPAISGPRGVAVCVAVLVALAGCAGSRTDVGRGQPLVVDPLFGWQPQPLQWQLEQLRQQEQQQQRLERWHQQLQRQERHQLYEQQIRQFQQFQWQQQQFRPPVMPVIPTGRW